MLLITKFIKWDSASITMAKRFPRIHSDGKFYNIKLGRTIAVVIISIVNFREIYFLFLFSVGTVIISWNSFFF